MFCYHPSKLIIHIKSPQSGCSCDYCFVHDTWGQKVECCCVFSRVLSKTNLTFANPWQAHNCLWHNDKRAKEMLMYILQGQRLWSQFGKVKSGESACSQHPSPPERQSVFWSLKRMQPTHISSPPGWLVLPKIHVLLWDVFRPQLIFCSHNPD